jgi:CDP-diacylglycerol--serine O-phosphatidyltransferase
MMMNNQFVPAFRTRARDMLGSIVLGHLGLATCLTLAGITLSILAVVFTTRGSLPIAVICFMYAGLCDLFDGFLARRTTRTNEQASFGLQIDSMADMAAFGVAPAFIGLNLGLTSPVEVTALVFYVCCAAMRLAFFNVHGTAEDGAHRWYTGVPVTYSALVFPVLLLFATAPNEPPLLWPIHGYFWVLGALFILRIPVPKPGGIFYVIFPLAALVLTFLWGLRL